jgi:hypothetical protein
MKKLILVTVLMVVLGACAPDGPTTGIGAGPTNPSTSTTLVDLETWCAGQNPDRCVEGLVYLDWNPGREACVFTARDDSLRFWEQCDTVEPDGVEPVTTIPTDESEAERLAAEQDFEWEMARRLPVLDERASALLTAVHPGGVVTAGLVFGNPLDLQAVEEMTAGNGAILVAAWRTDYLCLPGLEGFPMSQASRFAFLDGVERARQLREEMANSTTPVTGAHIPLNAFAVMEQEAVALREPGVLLAAVQATVPVDALEPLRDDPRIEAVRLADFPIEWFDLADARIPDCEGR